MVITCIIQIAMVLLDGATATNGWLAEILDKFNDQTVKEIWTGSGTDGSSPAYWSLLIPAASALGSVFALFLAARIAYRTMVLDKGLDILQMFRPLAVSLVLAFWYPVTWSLYSLTLPFEDFFRIAYEQKNDEVNRLKDQRARLALQLSDGVRLKASEAQAAQAAVDGVMADKQGDPDGSMDTPESGYNVMVNEMGDVIFDETSFMDPSQAIVTADGDTIHNTDILSMTTDASTFNFIENVILWLAEMFWMFGICTLFLIRNLYLTVLVFFGPVWMACTLLQVWKDKWADWVSRFVSVCLYGPLCYLGMIFALYLITFALKGDISRITEALTSEANLWSYIEYVSTGSFMTIGYYCIALVVGTAVIPLAVEFAGMVLPADVARGATSFFSGMQGKVNMAVEETEKAAKAVVVGAFTAGAGAVAETAAEKEVAKAAEKIDKMRPVEAWTEEAADAYTDNQAESFADRFWQQRMQEADDEQEAMQQALDDMDEFIRKAEAENGEEFVRRFQQRSLENAELYSIVCGKDAGRQIFQNEEQKKQFLEKMGLADLYDKRMELVDKAIKKEQKGDDATAEWAEYDYFDMLYKERAAAVFDMRDGRSVIRDEDRVTMEAQRAADRICAEEMLHDDGTQDSRSARERAGTAAEDLAALRRAEAEGRSDEYIRIREERIRENHMLAELAETGTIGLHWFGGSVAARNQFLAAHGLKDVVRKAEKMQRLAEKSYRSAHKTGRKDMQRYYKRIGAARDKAAADITRRIAGECRDRLYARGITGQFATAGYRNRFGGRYTSVPTADYKVARWKSERSRLAHRKVFLQEYNDGQYATLAGSSAWFTFFLEDEKARKDMRHELMQMKTMRSAAVRKNYLDRLRKKYSLVDGSTMSGAAFHMAVAEAAVDNPDIVTQVLDNLDEIEKAVQNKVDPRVNRKKG